MKKILFGLIITTNCLFGQSIINDPYFKSTTHDSLKIKKIILDDSGTKIEFSIEADKGWFCADQNYYIKDSKSDRKYLLTKADGVPVCPKTFKFDHNSLSFTLIFPAIDKDIEFIDIIEDCKDACVKIKEVSLNQLYTDIERKYQEAYDLYWNKNYKESLKKTIQLKTLIKDTLSIKYGQTLLLLGDNYFKTDDFSNAEKIYTIILHSSLNDQTETQEFYDPFNNFKFKACKGIANIYEKKEVWEKSLEYVNKLLDTYPFYSYSNTHWLEEATDKMEWQVYLLSKLERYEEAALTSLDFILNGLYSSPDYIVASSGTGKFYSRVNQGFVNIINNHFDYEEVLEQLDNSLQLLKITDDEKFYYGTISFMKKDFVFRYSKSWVKEGETFDKNYLIAKVKEQSFYEKLHLFNASNLKLKSGVYEYKNKPYTGEFYEFWFTGKLRTKGKMINGVLNDTLVQYFENGNLKSTDIYISGKLSGKSETYYDNGAIETEGFYKDNEPDGVWIYWYPSGHQNTPITFSGGSLSGFTINATSEESIKKKKKAEIKFSNGKENGSVTFWHEDGTVFRKGNYLNGMRTGKWVEKDEKGKIVKQATYKNGVLLNGESFDEN